MSERPRRLFAAVGLLAVMVGACSSGTNSEVSTRQGDKRATKAARSAADRQCRYILASTVTRRTPAPQPHDSDQLSLLRTVDVAPDTCYDRVTFNFQAVLPAKNLPPDYTVEYFPDLADKRGVTNPVKVTEPDDRGNMVQLQLQRPDRDAVIKITLAPTSIRNTTKPSRPLTYVGNLRLDLPGGLHHIIMVRKWLNDPDGVGVWVLELDRKRPFTVDTVKNSSGSTITVYVMR